MLDSEFLLGVPCIRTIVVWPMSGYIQELLSNSAFIKAMCKSTLLIHLLGGVRKHKASASVEYYMLKEST